MLNVLLFVILQKPKPYRNVLNVLLFVIFAETQAHAATKAVLVWQYVQRVGRGGCRCCAATQGYWWVYCRRVSVIREGRERERNVLFNDALNTFYLRLYGVRHMVKDHSDSEKGNPLPPYRLLLFINSKGSFICTIPQTG